MAGRRIAKPKPAPTGPERIPRRHQGWYRDRETGDRLRSVTTILNEGAPKEALIYWAGNLVAETAIERLPYLVRAARRPADRKEAYDWLRRAHTRKKDERKDVGSAVHKLIEAHILGEPVPAELLDDPEMRPYLEHFEQFITDYGVEFEASEMVVANPAEGYAGTLDYIVRSALIVHALNGMRVGGRLLVAEVWGMPPLDPAAPLMGDTKTGGELDVKGVYPEAALQMSSYRAATVCWLRDGTKVPMPSTQEVGVVLHLRPEGYRVIPVRCGSDVFATFRHVREVARWTRELSKDVVGEPITLPPPTPDLKETA